MRRQHLAVLSLLSAALCGAPRLTAQPTGMRVIWSDGAADPREAIVGLDGDDDDDDGVPDLEGARVDPAVDDDVSVVTVLGATTGAVRATVTGGLRLVGRDGLATTAVVPVTAGRAVVALVGVAVSLQARGASLVLEAGGSRTEVPITVVGLGFLGGDLSARYAHRDALAVSHQITTDASLPRDDDPDGHSPDPDNTRVEVWDPGAARGAAVRVASLGTRASLSVAVGEVRGQLRDVALARRVDGAAWRSTWVRLVGDEVDLRAPGVQSYALLVGLRDRVQASYTRPGAAGVAATELRVGRPGNEDTPLAARRGRWNIHVLRDRPAAAGGRPVVGDIDENALRIARRQVTIANEIYLQCMITFGGAAQAEVHIEDPPSAPLLAVADRDGLRAAGGVARFRVDGRVIGPVAQRPGASPLDTALALAEAVRAAGFTARVSRNARADFGSEGSVDVLVRDREGRPATLSAVPGAPLSTDTRQRIALGEVDLLDGVEEFNNLTSAAGTLEERSLVKPLQDDDPGSIDLFIINRFARSTRIGEAFVSNDRGTIVNALLLDRAGISTEREAWTQSHEAGHILLDQPWHPDNMGPDRPWLLMDADASLGAVTGPKRLTDEECRRIHAETGVGSARPALTRYDAVSPSADAPRFASWPAAPLWPRPPEATARATPPPPRATPTGVEDQGVRFID
jgi:hypothetical protein